MVGMALALAVYSWTRKEPERAGGLEENVSAEESADSISMDVPEVVASGAADSAGVGVSDAGTSEDERAAVDESPRSMNATSEEALTVDPGQASAVAVNEPTSLPAGSGDGPLGSKVSLPQRFLRVTDMDGQDLALTGCYSGTVEGPQSSVRSVRLFLTAGRTRGSLWNISGASYLEWVGADGNKRTVQGRELARSLLHDDVRSPVLYLKLASTRGQWLRMHLWANDESDRHYTADVLSRPSERGDEQLVVVGHGRLASSELSQCTEAAPERRRRP